MRSQWLLIVFFYRLADELTSAERYEADDAVALFQMHHETRLAPAGVEEQKGIYQAVGTLLSQNSHLSHSLQILQYVAKSAYAPELGRGGCLYLPNDAAWRQFYHYVEHPYPPLFAEMIANAYDPSCNKSTARSTHNGRQMPPCPDGHVRGSHWEMFQTGAEGMWPSRFSCLGARHKGYAGGIQVFETAGHVGLPWKWQSHVNGITNGGQMVPSIMRKRKMRRRFNSDLCLDAEKLPAAPEDKKLVIPTRFIVCCASIDNCPMDKEAVRQQVFWMNKGYAGEEPRHLEDFDKGVDPPHVDMQVQFELIDARLVEDKECAQNMFMNQKAAWQHNVDGTGVLTYVIATDDQSGVLGVAAFPTEVAEDNQELLVQINMFAIRNMSTRTHQPDLSYDEGDTCIHEGGHSLGLFHTFEEGCTDGDKVSDTNPEEFPSYACQDSRSCGSTDPVHNFMDYAPDSCMSGFTEQQKRRMWCVIEHHRPVMYGRALRSK